jgi:hypothetical protein
MKLATMKSVIRNCFPMARFTEAIPRGSRRRLEWCPRARERCIFHARGMAVHGVEVGVGRRSLEPKGEKSMMEQLEPFMRSMFQLKDDLEQPHDARCLRPPHGARSSVVIWAVACRSTHGGPR